MNSHPTDYVRTFTSSASSGSQFHEFFIQTPRFNLIIAKLTNNTYVLATLPPGESELNCTRVNIGTARDEFIRLDTSLDRFPYERLTSDDRERREFMGKLSDDRDGGVH